MAETVERPNIVFIMVDDLGAEAIQCYGGESYDTPNIDELAHTGLQFTNAYATPLSTPTRVQLMTGQYPFNNGWAEGIWTFPIEEQLLDPQNFNFARMLKNAGYATAVAGKWQLARFVDRPDHPQNIGFDQHCLWTWRMSDSSIPSYVSKEADHKPSRYWSPGIWKTGELMKDTHGKFGPDICSKFLLDFMEEHKSEPFFIYYPMLLPHSPFISVPGMKEGTYTEQEKFGAMVEYIDMLVGKFIDKLKKLGIYNNTLFFFTGDNGTPNSITSKLNERSIRGGKGELNDAGSRVPFLVSWPNLIDRSKVITDLIDFTDILPTFAEAAVPKIPDSHIVDGKSFLPLVKDKEVSHRNWVFCQAGQNWFIRTRNYRLYNDGKFEFLKSHYFPENVNVEKNQEAKQVKQDLLDIADSLGIK